MFMRNNRFLIWICATDLMSDRFILLLGLFYNSGMSRLNMNIRCQSCIDSLIIVFERVINFNFIKFLLEKWKNEKFFLKQIMICLKCILEMVVYGAAGIEWNLACKTLQTLTLLSPTKDLKFWNQASRTWSLERNCGLKLNPCLGVEILHLL